VPIAAGAPCCARRKEMACDRSSFPIGDATVVRRASNLSPLGPHCGVFCRWNATTRCARSRVFLPVEYRRPDGNAEPGNEPALAGERCARAELNVSSGNNWRVRKRTLDSSWVIGTRRPFRTLAKGRLRVKAGRDHSTWFRRQLSHDDVAEWILPMRVASR
jgi:hypothetical protein